MSEAYEVGDVVIVIGTEYGTILEVREDDHYHVAVKNRGECLLHTSHLSLALKKAQTEALAAKCEQYGVPFSPENFTPQFDLHAGWVGGRIDTIYVGCSPEGGINS